MHRLIALWSHPRSMSTAIERVMRERGDLDCAHEPFMYDYYVHRGESHTPHFDIDPGHPVTYPDIRDMLLERAERRPVFVKDMAYYMLPHLLDDTEFCSRLTHCFLIRDPVASILSYHKLDPELTCEEVGLKAQWELFEALRDRYGVTAPVIEAEAVQGDTVGVIGRWWEAIGLPFVAEAFDWSDSEHPEDWQRVVGWHESVTGSGGIRMAGGDEAARRMAEFTERAQKFPKLAEYLAAHRPAYERLRRYSLTAGHGG